MDRFRRRDARGGQRAGRQRGAGKDDGHGWIVVFSLGVDSCLAVVKVSCLVVDGLIGEIWRI